MPKVCGQLRIPVERLLRHGSSSAQHGVRGMCLAVPGKVIEISGEDPLLPTARVDFGGVVKQINLAYTPHARPGDYVLAHVGFALTVIDEAEAARTLDALHEVADGLIDTRRPQWTSRA